MAIDFTNPEVLTELKAAGYSGKDDISQMIQDSNKSLETNRNDILSQLQDQKEKFKGVDLAAYTKLAEDKRFTSVLSSGFDEYERGMGGELQERLRAAQSDLMLKDQNHLRDQETNKQTVIGFESKLMKSELKRQLGLALMKNELVDPLAIPDIERIAMEELSLDDKNEIIILGAEGIPKQTAEGPMRVTDWMKDMMKVKPYFFRGANGGQRHTENGVIDTKGMTPSQKMAASRRQV